MITNRDRDIVDWIARVGAVEPAHVMFRFAMGRTVAYRRLAALEAAGLVERVRLLHGEPGLIVVTKAGLRLCGLQALGVTKVSAGVARHWQASSLVAVILEHHHGRGAVGGVREIRAAERATGKPVASVAIGAASHICDLVIWGPKGFGRPGGTAVEVELTAKAPERLRSILHGWCRAHAIGPSRAFSTSAGPKPNGRSCAPSRASRLSRESKSPVCLRWTLSPGGLRHERRHVREGWRLCA